MKRIPLFTVPSYFLSMASAVVMMDAFAAIKRYNGIGSACSYATSSISAFKADADKCVDIRDRTLMALYDYLNKLVEGAVAVPKTTAEIDAILPEMVW